MTEVTPVPVSAWLIRVARLRVTAGFCVAVAAFWLARPTWLSLGVGATVALVGESMRVWAAGHLEKGLEVTTSGPYRWMRHPLYVGSSLLGAGFAAASRHPVAAALVVVYLAVSLQVAARLEEATLRVKFGDAYDRYVRGVAKSSSRPFSAGRARRNGEAQAVLGVLAALAILGMKVWLAD
ncbi:MAG: S-isoprenylcysteine methyltransferase [Acidobacteria bacterium]|jgi:protein-S-isoprenylcysteine O-methyltransferase Ste14|nr:S-isoprenylcysteine methyltransferase [Acidobacteriota bacterium]MDP7477996.1 isoprenylcysteine carboxylmethyltransferase family protein [Vicinamibacterales bacterium]MDP7690455.1 isoprenylcysteine carboxylmethyltransferase family protein [Vicinamibacterales bacterium]HJN43470.1 isoprenylcysteine carboxylmethyltransferase family protein [Vicinamibacterales bacterium]